MYLPPIPGRTFYTMFLQRAMFCLSWYSATNAFGQAESDSKKNDKEAINQFYYFELPSAINGSNLDPSPISNFTSNFTDSKISLKLGFPSFYKETPKIESLKTSGFLQLNFKASNGLSTLYKSESPPLEYGLSGGFSLICKHSYWTFTDTDEYGVDTHSSEAMTWVNIIGSLERGNYNLFNSGEYGDLLTKQTEINGSLFVSLNRYFFSRIPKYRWRSIISSIGLGYAKTNDYSSLSKRTLEEGQLVYNADSTLYESIVKTTAGANGRMTICQGLTGFIEAFIPILKNKKYGALHLGNRITYFGIGNNKYIINAHTGFYVNLKDKKIEGNKPAKDIISFSITAQYNQLNKSHEEDYIDDNFSVVLQAAIPIKFN